STIKDVEKAIRSGRAPDAAALQKTIEGIEMQNKADWMKKYYGNEAWEKVEQRRQLWSPELQERVSRQWSELIADVETALDQDPAGEVAQGLAARWKLLVEGFTGGDPGIAAGVKNLYADSPNWPEAFKQQMVPFRNPKVWEFIHKAMACRKA